MKQIPSEDDPILITSYERRRIMVKRVIFTHHLFDYPETEEEGVIYIMNLSGINNK